MAFPQASICNDTVNPLAPTPVPAAPPSGFPQAPICPDPQSETFRGKVAPLFPVIPQAVDMPSLIAAVNAMRLAIQQLAGQLPVSLGARQGFFPIEGQAALRNNNRNTNTPNKKGRLTEVSRVTEKVRITSKDDEDVWIDILRINEITFRDRVTDELLVWNR